MAIAPAGIEDGSPAELDCIIESCLYGGRLLAEFITGENE
jgi:hypothetical protein